MPNWKTHIEIGKILNKEIKYTGSEYELFLLGNILPDINNKYLLKNIKNKVEHKITHYTNPDIPTYLKFKEEHGGKVDINPLIYGYYIHLCTDYIWNKDFVDNHKVKKQYVDLSAEELRIIKQNDFAIFNNNFFENNLEKLEAEEVMKYINQLKRVNLSKSEVESIKEFLKSQELKNSKLQIYTNEELLGLFNNSIEQIKKLI